MGFADLLRTVDVTVRRHAGDLVLYAPGVGEAVEVFGVFDRLYSRVDLGNPGVTSSGPAVFLTLSDLPSNPLADEGARLTIFGVVYCVSEAQPDGTGAVVLHLHEVST